MERRAEASKAAEEAARHNLHVAKRKRQWKGLCWCADCKRTDGTDPSTRCLYIAAQTAAGHWGVEVEDVLKNDPYYELAGDVIHRLRVAPGNQAFAEDNFQADRVDEDERVSWQVRREELGLRCLWWAGWWAGCRSLPRMLASLPPTCRRSLPAEGVPAPAHSPRPLRRHPCIRQPCTVHARSSEASLKLVRRGLAPMEHTSATTPAESLQTPSTAPLARCLVKTEAMFADWPGLRELEVLVEVREGLVEVQELWEGLVEVREVREGLVEVREVRETCSRSCGETWRGSWVSGVDIQARP